MSVEGSSPLARGTRRGLYRWPRFGGLIPARAGNTLGSSSSPQPNRAHPRSRGEHRSEASALGRMPGSSPLARGTPIAHESGLPSLGLIPARAGNTAWLSSLAGETGAHPRSRGEHGLSGRRRLGLRGSSPLARGTQYSACQYSPCDGLIPARAGNTWRSVSLGCPGGAHPRSRGEH